MYYEINVAYNGKHFFATSERSIQNRKRLEEIYIVFKEKFPKEEGYELFVTQWDKSGTHIQMED